MTASTGPDYGPMLGSREADARLTAILHSKPVDDDVPLAAWWFVATSLEVAVCIRRGLEGVEPLTGADLERAAQRAQDAARAALEELGEHHSRIFIAPEFPPSQIDPLSVLRCTIHQLARLTVRSQATPAEQLSSRLHAHIDALLRACIDRRPAAADGTPPPSKEDRDASLRV